MKPHSIDCHAVAAALLAAVLLGWPGPASAQAPTAPPTEQIVEGYARPDYRELVQTMVVLGAYDVAKPQVANEYAKLMECASYKKFYRDDFSWNEVRSKVVQRVQSRKEPYRVYYEYPAVIRLGNYNFQTQTFPLTNGTKFVNVGRMDVVTPEGADAAICRTGDDEADDRSKPFFPTTIGMELGEPLSLTQLSIPSDRAEALLAKLQARGVTDRSLYARFRFRAIDQPKLLADRFGQTWRGDMRGRLQAVDIFLDRELTMWLMSVPVDKN
jgi:hypothetical protein